MAVAARSQARPATIDVFPPTIIIRRAWVALVDRSIDIDELWRVAARRMRAPAEAPRDVHVEGLRALAAAVSSKGRYDADALQRLQRDLFLRIVADLKLSRDLARYSAVASVPM